MPKRTAKSRYREIPYRDRSGGLLNFSKLEVLWAAGFFEGEGGIGEKAVAVSQVNIWPLEKLQGTFGGSINQRKLKEGERRQPIYQWWICGPDGRDFIAAIYPFLSPRRQAQIDEKFMTWAKFRLGISERRQRQREHLSRVASGRDMESGRFRCLNTQVLESALRLVK